MKILGVLSGSKPTKGGVFIVIPSTNGAVKLSRDLCAEYGITKGDKMVIVPTMFDGSEGLGLTGDFIAIRKANAEDDKFTTFGTQPGSFLQGSAALAHQQLRTAKYAGADVAEKESVTYDVKKVEEDGVVYLILCNPVIKAKAEDEDEDENNDDTKAGNGEVAEMQTVTENVESNETSEEGESNVGETVEDF